ncbi:MAG: hypothetical protein ACRESJ_01885 [Pseudomonas sp.]|uniref:hypothetical protein n=1 Tax=Pseudomonas sp. TaxID=306 RepID=UPI003D6E162C
MGNSSDALIAPIGIPPALATTTNGDIPPPILLRNLFGASDFSSQSDLEYQWASFKTQLKTQTLSEQEVLAVLSSGILQTETGKAIVGLFSDAMLRSIRPLGSLTRDHLKEIVKVVCELPPSQWQCALGENIRFVGGQAQGVAGFIQAQLVRSSDLRDEKIAINELLTDAQWEFLKQLTTQGRQYIRASDFKLYDALTMLEDSSDLRPSPAEAHAQLKTFVDLLENSDVKRVRWPQHYEAAARALCEQLKPDVEVEQSWLQWLVGPSWLEGVFGCRDSSSVPSSHVKSAPTDAGSRWLLSALETFERSADFYSNITHNGPRVPQSFVGKLLWVCNALDTFGALKLDSSHITSRPLRLDTSPVTAQAGSQPNGEAWKNGASDFSRVPSKPIATAADPLAMMSQIAAQADELLGQITGKLMPWDSVGAHEVVEMTELLQELPSPYQPTTTNLEPPSADYSSQMRAIGDYFSTWLGRMSGTLLSTGAATLGRAGDLIEQNPGKTAGAFAAYVAISNLYAQWFLPETISPVLSSVSSDDQYFFADPVTEIEEHILDDLDYLLVEFPALASELEGRVRQSRYADPHLDPELLEDIQVMLQETAQDSRVSYKERIEEIIQLAQIDELDEVADFSTDSRSIQVAESEPLSRKPRSVDAFGLVPGYAQAHIRAVHWAVEASREIKMAPVSLEQQKGEIAPGLTLQKAADKVIEAFRAAEAIVDPQQFIQNSVNTIISESSLPRSLKSTLNPKSTIEVRFKESVMPDKFNNRKASRERVQPFTLAELCVDYHLRVKASNEEFTILWPSHFPESFKNTIIHADLQAAYKETIKSTLERPDVKELWKLSKEYELKTTLESYKNSRNASAEGISISDKFLQGKKTSHLIYLNDPRENSPSKVSNAVYLGDNLDGMGLFVFLGGNNTVIELPAGSERKQNVIENNKPLQQALMDRIPLYEKLSRQDEDFKYGKPVFNIFNKYPLYAPVLFDSSKDAVEDLYKRQLSQALSDMDTLVSTDEERFTDGLIAAVGKVLTALSIVAFFPGASVLATHGARMAASFLFGASASATELLRGAVADDPTTAANFRSNAYRGFIMEFAGPLAGKLFGKTFSSLVASRIGRSVFNGIKSMGHKIAKPIKFIPPIVPNTAALTAKLEAKFKSHRTVSQLKQLYKGPKQAQKLIKDTKNVHFSGPKEGYVYQGFVMRGDRRPPKEVFEKGFKLRTPITDVSQVNGMRGGFGGGKDALDMDGMGISTSAYYKQSGAGAFQYGGGRGGYTYLVDGRNMRGYHLYANDHWKKYPDSKLGMRPYEVNYGQDIPASAVIGAYDKQGKFIPNPSALIKSIEGSRPAQLPGGVFYQPAISIFKSARFNSTLSDRS